MAITFTVTRSKSNDLRDEQLALPRKLLFRYLFQSREPNKKSGLSVIVLAIAGFVLDPSPFLKELLEARADE